jgi:ADP-ribose pyrophosphatase YjhB (NUDIX family)
MEYWKFIRDRVGKRRVIIPGVDVAIVRDNKILLVKTIDNGHWFLPGGLQELNETVFDTGVREVQEELNLTVNANSLISVFSGPKWIRRYSNGDELQSLTFLISATIQSDIKNIMIDQYEIQEYGWFPFSALPDELHDYTSVMIEDVEGYCGKTFLR